MKINLYIFGPLMEARLFFRSTSVTWSSRLVLEQETMTCFLLLQEIQISFQRWGHSCQQTHSWAGKWIEIGELGN